MSRCHLPWCRLAHEDVSASEPAHTSDETPVDLALDSVRLSVSAVAYDASAAPRPLLVLRTEQRELVDKDWVLLSPEEAIRLAHALLEIAEAVRPASAQARGCASS